TGDGRWLFREVTAHRSGAAVAVGRLVFVLSAAIPLTLVLQGIWWAFQIRSEKRTRLAALAPSASPELPRVFYPNPTAEWSAAMVPLFILGGVGSLLAGFSIYSGFESTFMQWGQYIILGIGVTVALVVAWYAKSHVVTIRIDAASISYAKGRG